MGRLVAVVTILLQGLHDDGLDVTSEGAINRAGPARSLFTDHPRRFEDRHAFKVVGQGITEQFIENDTQRVHIASCIEKIRIGLALLRAHVLHGSQQLADIGLQRRDCHVRVRGPCNAEVDDLRLAVGVHEDVAGLQVAMNDSLLVSMAYSVTDLGEELEPIPCSHVLGVGIVIEILGADDVLHGEPRHAATAIVPGPGLVDLGDALVVQASKHLRFEGEASLGSSGGYAASHDLDGDLATRVVLDTLVDGTHAAGTDDTSNREMRDLRGMCFPEGGWRLGNWSNGWCACDILRSGFNQFTDFYKEGCIFSTGGGDEEIPHLALKGKCCVCD